MTAIPDFDIWACKPMNPDWIRDHGLTPNRAFTRPTDDGGRFAYLVVRRSPARGTFALTKAGLDHFANATNVVGAVALTEADDSNVLTVPVAEMVRRLAGVTPLIGKWGAYCWIKSTGYPDSGYYDDEPF